MKTGFIAALAFAAAAVAATAALDAAQHAIGDVRRHDMRRE